MMLKKIETSNFKPSSNILQSGFWACFKAEFGWKPFAFDNNGKNFLVLCRQLSATYSLCYIPHGPELGDFSWEECKRIAQEIKPHLPNKCMFLRIDPQWGIAYPALGKEINNYPEIELSAPKPFLKANMDIQPPSTVVLNLSESEEIILSGMKAKTRYNIRLAAKKGVTVKKAGSEELSQWYEIYKQTALRDKISIHPYKYYKRLFSLAEEIKTSRTKTIDSPELCLLLAEIDGRVEAGIIVAIQGGKDCPGKASYLYGASSNNKRNYMPAYALQWEGIKLARNAGCVSYDFCGIPPVDNPNHPMYGLYRFKTGFGGEIIHRPGSWDFPYKKGIYNLFRKAEKARNYYYKTLKKKR